MNHRNRICRLLLIKMKIRKNCLLKKEDHYYFMKSHLKKNFKNNNQLFKICPKILKDFPFKCLKI
jgi:hypothetical protein